VADRRRYVQPGASCTDVTTTRVETNAASYPDPDDESVAAGRSAFRPTGPAHGLTEQSMADGRANDYGRPGRSFIINACNVFCVRDGEKKFSTVSTIVHTLPPRARRVATFTPVAEAGSGTAGWNVSFLGVWSFYVYAIVIYAIIIRARECWNSCSYENIAFGDNK